MCGSSAPPRAAAIQPKPKPQPKKQPARPAQGGGAKSGSGVVSFGGQKAAGGESPSSALLAPSNIFDTTLNLGSNRLV